MLAAGMDDSFGDELDAHCQVASTDAIRRDRIGVVGSALGAIGWVGGVLPFAMIVALTALETLVAFLQAYVFAILTCIYIILAEGLNIVVGFTGLLNLGFVAFYAIGAYTAADITYRWSNDGNGLDAFLEVAEELVQVVDDHPCPVGAGVDAMAATDAQVLINHRTFHDVPSTTIGGQLSPYKMFFMTD